MSPEKQIRESLTAGEYWEWRTTIAEVEIEKLKLLKAELGLKLLHRDAEILQARQQLFIRTQLETAKGGLEMARSEYERFKKALEESLGQSLSNKSIDDVTYKIVELPGETNLPPEGAKEI